MKVFEPDHYFQQPPRYNIFDGMQVAVLGIFVSLTRSVAIACLVAERRFEIGGAIAALVACLVLLATNLHFYYGGKHRNWLQTVCVVLVPLEVWWLLHVG